jgi:hypothetical protein
LTFIHFQGYRGNQLEFTGYILQNGLVLKTMIIDDLFIDSLDQPEEWLEKISDLPRGQGRTWTEIIGVAKKISHY